MILILYSEAEAERIISVDLPIREQIAAVGLDHNPCTGVHSDDAVVFGSDRVFLDQTVHRTALCLRKSGRLVGVGRLCKCIDRLRGKCAIKYLGIADCLNTQRKRIFPVIFTQALKRLHGERLCSVVYSGLIGTVKLQQVSELEKDDYEDDRCRDCSELEILPASVDFLTLDQVIVRTPQHGAQDSRKLQTAGSGPIQPEIGAEGFAVYHFTGTVIGRASRASCHSGTKLLHPVVHLHIINRFGQVYLQRRAATKTLLPLYWDTAVGGHVNYGEYLREALFREAAEELGFFDFNPVLLVSYIYESPIEKELVNTFATVGNFTLKPDGTEVCEGKWWTIEEIEAAFGKDILTPNFEYEFPKIKQSLLALL